MESGTAVVGRRERSKLDKRRRISEAARAVFTEFGYERANMREIAKRAGVATGTLFLYAPDKRNLLLWILNDDLDEITTETFHELEREHADAGLIDQLMHLFEARYRYWGNDPDLSLHALQVLILTRDAAERPMGHLAGYQARRVALYDGVSNVIRAQQKRGAIDASADPDVLSRMVLAIYNAAIRTWLRTGTPELSEGLAEMRLLLRTAIEGSVRTIGRGVDGRSN